MFTALAAVCLSSCKDEEWQPGAESNYSGINVYFVQPETYYSLQPDATEITFTVQRDDAPYEDQYVPVTLTSVHPDAFETPEPVFFRAGELEAELTIYFTDRMQLFHEYAFSIAIDENYTQQYMEQTDSPRIDVTVIKEDYENRYLGVYTYGAGGASLIGTSGRNCYLEYSEILDTYRFDPWDSGVYITFTMGDENESGATILELDAQSYNTGLLYETGDDSFEISATVAGTCTCRNTVYTFPFDYGYSGASTGTYNDTYQIIREL